VHEFGAALCDEVRGRLLASGRFTSAMSRRSTEPASCIDLAERETAYFFYVLEQFRDAAVGRILFVVPASYPTKSRRSCGEEEIELLLEERSSSSPNS